MLSGCCEMPASEVSFIFHKDRRMRTSILAFAALTFSSALVCPSFDSLRADDTKAPAKIQQWKPEDIIYAEAAQPQPRISPDAKWLVWVKSTGDKDKDARVSNLILSSLTENREIQLTRGSDNNGQPQWSPDGQLLAFTSNRARFGAKPETAPVQIWLINA